MKEFLTSMGIWVGAVTAVLAIVDWILTEPQKKLLRGWGEHAWLWLDDQRMGTFLKFVRKRSLQIVASVVIIVFFLLTGILGFVLELHSGSVVDRRIYLVAGAYSASLLAAMGFVAWKIHPRITDWILRSGTLLGFFIRCLLISSICLAAAFLIDNRATFLVAAAERNERMRMTYLIILSIIYLATSPIRFEAGLVSTMLILSFVWFVMVLMLIALFAIIKFFLLRIVEYPKGPVLGLSGLLIAIAALVKIFV
jgi:hypothetical protein